MWLIGIGIFILLLIWFPKQMSVVVFAGVCVVAAIVFSVIRSNHQENERVANDVAKVRIEAAIDASACLETQYPVAVRFTNTDAKRTLEFVSFGLRAFRPGMDGSVLEQDSLKSDKTIAPGETWLACWDSPGAPPAGFTLRDLRWTAEASEARFR